MTSPDCEVWTAIRRAGTMLIAASDCQNDAERWTMMRAAFLLAVDGIERYRRIAPRTAQLRAMVGDRRALDTDS